jgi:signal transduction histidine kinase
MKLKYSNFSKIFLGSLLILSIISIILSFFIFKDIQTKDISQQNKLISQQLVYSISMIISTSISRINYGIEYMKRFDIYNSTLSDYRDLSSFSSSDDINASALFLVYNISIINIEEYKNKINKQLNTNINITEIDNGFVVPAKLRNWYCPEFFVTPFIYQTYKPGLDLCNVFTYDNLVNGIINTNEIVIKPRKGYFINNSFLDFGIKTYNGFVILSLNLNDVFNILNVENQKIILLKDNATLYQNNISNTDPNSLITDRINLPNDNYIEFSIYFEKYNYSITNFLIVLLCIIIINILLFIITLNLEKQKERFELANKMLGYINHEIRNPLNCINGLIEISIMELSEDNRYIELKSNLNIAKNACDMLGHIVNDILDLKKLNDGKLIINKENIIIKDFINTFNQIIETKLSEHPNIVYSFENVDDIEIINSDQYRISQLLLNFFTNSFNFTDSGFIKIKLEKININDVKFSVQDSGEGISKTNIPLIFLPFTHEMINSSRHGGIGLGLYLCKMITNQLKGTIGFTSQVKVGSTFWFILPESIVA